MGKYSKYKDSGVDWIGEIPEGWGVVPLHAFAVFRKGLAITKASLVDEGVPVLSYGQIHSKAHKAAGIEKELIRFVAKDCPALTEASFADKGTLIMADTSEDVEGSGNCAYVDCPDGLYAGYHTLLIDPSAAVRGKYLGYLAMTDEWRSQIRSRVSGVKLYSITQKILKDVSILIPPKEEKQAIADYLDEKTAAIDASVADIERSIALLNEYRQSVISEAVTKGLNPNVSMKDSDVEWIGQVPAHWSVLYPKKLFALRKDRAHMDDQQLTASQKYGVISQKHFMELENQRVMSVITGNDILKHVEAGDFVISMRSFQGGLEYSYETGKISSAYVMVYPFTNQVYSEYYRHLFKTSNYIQALQSTSNLVRDGQALRYMNFTQVYLPVPPLNEQQEIAKYLDDYTNSIDSLITQKQSLLVRLKEYRSSLISECVTGKVRVPGVEE